MNCYKCNKPITKSYVKIVAFVNFGGGYMKSEEDKYLLCPRCYEIFKGNKVKK